MNRRAALNSILDHLIEAQTVIAGITCLFLFVTHSFVWLYACGALMLMTLALRYEYHLRRLAQSGAATTPMAFARKAWLSAALLSASFVLVPMSIILSQHHPLETLAPAPSSLGAHPVVDPSADK